MFEKILGNIPKDSGEYLKRYREIIDKIPGNVQVDSGESWKRFWEMLEKILGNVREDSRESSRRFRETFSISTLRQIKHMLSHDSKRDLCLLFPIKQ